MGTTYHVTVVARDAAVADLQRRIEARLAEIEGRLSTFRRDSEISRFNRLRRVGEPFPVSADFLRVMRTAARVHALSGGAWDGTVMPLVELWGFGPKGAVTEPPPADQVGSRLRLVGFQKIEIHEPDRLVKRDPEVTLDLSSIAKGYGVDEAAAVVRGQGFADFVVEVGGEVVASGRRPDGRPWRVGVQRPRSGATAEELHGVVSLRNAAFATSGDYHNHFEWKGVRYSHVIDPRTGYPVKNHVVSVSILAPDCTLADGLATAVMVMGPSAGLVMLARLPGVEGLVVTEEERGTFTDHHTPGFTMEPGPEPE
jgi:thiamine biosynthesis lipoprotein